MGSREYVRQECRTHKIGVGPTFLSDSDPRRIDWRGWIVLAWVVFWGAAYLRMAVAPRLTPAIRWLLSMIG